MTVAGSVMAISVKSCGALLLLSPDGIATGVKQHGAIGRDSMRPVRNHSIRCGRTALHHSMRPDCTGVTPQSGPRASILGHSIFHIIAVLP